MAKKKKNPSKTSRSIRIQQILFIFLGLIIILSMVLAMVAN
jgi:hypothetical protein